MSMFSRNRKRDGEEEQPPMEGEDELALPAKPGARAAGAMPNRPGPMPPGRQDARANEPRPGNARAAEARPAEPPAQTPEFARPADMARRLVDAPPPTPAPAAAPIPRRDPEVRKLTVGREISLKGEITSCDHLVVEGSVEANLAGCREVDIAESGIYKGSADIEEADIRGQFEGTMSVSGRLLIRSTGRVSGKVHYGQIEIEIGGQISGEVQASRSNSAAMAGASRSKADAKV
jgi:cytoskeletal protein CcmA (bactofilin family)